MLILQAVEHAQIEGGSNPFANFVVALQQDERRVNNLETGVTSILSRLSTPELKRHRGFRHLIFTSAEVDTLLKSAYRLRELSDTLNLGANQADVAIEIERCSDGSLVVFPAVAA